MKINTLIAVVTLAIVSLLVFFYRPQRPGTHSIPQRSSQGLNQTIAQKMPETRSTLLRCSQCLNQATAHTSSAYDTEESDQIAERETMLRGISFLALGYLEKMLEADLVVASSERNPRYCSREQVFMRVKQVTARIFGRNQSVLSRADHSGVNHFQCELRGVGKVIGLIGQALVSQGVIEDKAWVGVEPFLECEFTCRSGSVV